MIAPSCQPHEALNWFLVKLVSPSCRHSVGPWVDVMSAPVDEEIAFWHHCCISMTSTSFCMALDEAISHFFLKHCRFLIVNGSKSLSLGKVALICMPVDADKWWIFVVCAVSEKAQHCQRRLYLSAWWYAYNVWRIQSRFLSLIEKSRIKYFYFKDGRCMSDRVHCQISQELVWHQVPAPQGFHWWFQYCMSYRRIGWLGDECRGPNSCCRKHPPPNHDTVSATFRWLPHTLWVQSFPQFDVEHNAIWPKWISLLLRSHNMLLSKG